MRRFAVFLALFVVCSVSAVQGETARTETLDRLFAALYRTSDTSEATRLTSMIWVVWGYNEDPETERLLAEGTEAMEKLEFDTALDRFDAVIGRDPDFAEGWNKRATLFYVMGKFRDSIDDIQEVLAREPRHFGALAGLGMNYEALGDDMAALNAWRRALKANPHLRNAEKRIRMLETMLMNRPI